MVRKWLEEKEDYNLSYFITFLTISTYSWFILGGFCEPFKYFEMDSILLILAKKNSIWGYDFSTSTPKYSSIVKTTSNKPKSASDKLLPTKWPFEPLSTRIVSKIGKNFGKETFLAYSNTSSL